MQVGDDGFLPLLDQANQGRALFALRARLLAIGDPVRQRHAQGQHQQAPSPSGQAQGGGIGGGRRVLQAADESVRIR